jgi:PleD family two-component response regulator
MRIVDLNWFILQPGWERGTVSGFPPGHFRPKLNDQQVSGVARFLNRYLQRRAAMVGRVEVAHTTTTPRIARKVAIVNGSTDVLEVLETVLDAGQYDLVFVDANERAYSQIRTMQPDLVILCVRIEDLDGFHLLSMLKLDDETRSIPVLTYTTEYEGQDDEDRFTRLDESLAHTQAALRMN